MKRFIEQLGSFVFLFGALGLLAAMLAAEAACNMIWFCK
jgi:hypothetical protein